MFSSIKKTNSIYKIYNIKCFSKREEDCDVNLRIVLLNNQRAEKSQFFKTNAAYFKKIISKFTSSNLKS